MADNDDGALHMVQMWLDTKRLMELGRALHLPLHKVDNNYLSHCALGELFQEQNPQPFYVDERESGRHVRLLGYSSVPGDSLHALAQGFASPMVYEICDWDRLASKPMPEAFPDGMRLGFELRACPVIRKASDGPKWSKGQELDAFLSRVWEVDDRSVEIDREAVYREWLEGHFDRRGGARPLHIELDRFSLEDMLRRTHGESRKARTITRPAATLSGELEVTDGAQFAELLARGIGRHRSFGFGMLKVQRA